MINILDELNLQWRIYKMKRQYIIDKCIKNKTLPKKCEMQRYNFSLDELLPVYKTYLKNKCGTDQYMFKGSEFDTI